MARADDNPLRRDTLVRMGRAKSWQAQGLARGRRRLRRESGSHYRSLPPCYCRRRFDRWFWWWLADETAVTRRGEGSLMPFALLQRSLDQTIDREALEEAA